MKTPMRIQAQNHYLLQERHCKIIFVATAMDTAHSKIIFFLHVHR